MRVHPCHNYIEDVTSNLGICAICRLLCTIWGSPDCAAIWGFSECSSTIPSGDLSNLRIIFLHNLQIAQAQSADRSGAVCRSLRRNLQIAQLSNLQIAQLHNLQIARAQSADCSRAICRSLRDNLQIAQDYQLENKYSL